MHPIGTQWLRRQAVGAPGTYSASLGALAFVLTLGAGAVTAAGFLGELHWLLDLWSHFRVHAAATLAVATLLAMLAGRKRLAATAFALAVANAAVVAPLFAGRREAPAGARTLKIVVANVLTENTDAAGLAAFIRARDPDVVGLVEVSDRWLRDLAPLFAGWPEPVAEPRPDNFGVALFSRVPMTGRIERFGPIGEPTVVARLESAAGPLTVVVTHPIPPMSRETAAARDAHLDALAAARPAWGRSAVVMGDLNATPWSAPFRRLVARAGLLDARRGFGVVPTWPANLPVPGIPIDHVLLTPELVPLRFERGPAIGSDHFPLFVEIALP